MGHGYGLAHIQAMARPDAAGQRFLAQHVERLTYPEMADMLREAGYAHYPLPDGSTKVNGGTLPAPGARHVVDNSRLTKVLGVSLRPVQESLAAMAESLINTGVVDALAKSRL